MTPDIERLDDDEIEAALTALDGWEMVDGRLYREYGFDDFVEAIGFMVRAAVWAEMLNHHPDWSNLHKTVRIWLETHDVDGISRLDLELAARAVFVGGRGDLPCPSLDPLI